MNRLKVAIVVMAQNPYQYLAEFIANHLNLVDGIYLIDHRSTVNLKDIKVEGLYHIKSDQLAQFQSEAINCVVRDYKIYEKYDWIFVLDVDEFLPFQTRNELNKFLGMNKSRKILAFNWINGVGVYPSRERVPEDEGRSLIDVSPITISKVMNPNIKVCVNCRRLDYPFFFKTGAHEVTKLRFLNRFLPLRLKYYSIKPLLTNLALFHILAYDKSSFYLKIKNYVSQMEMRKHVLGQGGWMVRDYLKDFDDERWLNAIQNFRVTDLNLQLTEVNENIFTKVNIFQHIQPKIINNIKINIWNASVKALPNQSEEEVEYLLNKKYDFDIAFNIKAFKVRKCLGSDTIEIITKNSIYN